MRFTTGLTSWEQASRATRNRLPVEIGRLKTQPGPFFRADVTKVDANLMNRQQRRGVVTDE